MLDFGFYNMDCMEGMSQFPDKFFDLAIVDPPSGQNFDEEISGMVLNSKSERWKEPKLKGYYKDKRWDIKPNKEYFNELFRVSKDQIIWCANHYELPQSSGWIFWDKETGDFSLGDGELAWTSFQRAVKQFTYLWHGFRKHKYENRIHPTQKPINLYRWIIQNYAQPGWKLIDTHVGSASSLIAFEMEGFNDYVGFELDQDYYRDAKNRLETWRKNRHPELFDISEYKQVSNW